MWQARSLSNSFLTALAYKLRIYGYLELPGGESCAAQLLPLHRQLIFLMAVVLLPIAARAYPAGQTHLGASLARAAVVARITRIRAYAGAGLGSAKACCETNHRRQCKFPHRHYPRVAWLLTYPLIKIITVG